MSGRKEPGQDPGEGPLVEKVSGQEGKLATSSRGGMAAMNRPRMMLRIEREETQSVIGKAH